MCAFATITPHRLHLKRPLTIRRKLPSLLHLRKRKRPPKAPETASRRQCLSDKKPYFIRLLAFLGLLDGIPIPWRID